MSDLLSPTAILFIFYGIFLSQIFILSIYFPRIIAERVNYIVTNYPHAEYPNLYPNYIDGFEQRAIKRMVTFKAVNYTIAAIGVGILGTMVSKGYTPAHKGGDEIFVMFYFFLQLIPLGFIHVTEMKSYRAMHKHFKNRVRKAELSARKLSDYISPFYVLLAFILYCAWVTYLLIGQGPIDTWVTELYVTIIGITLINIMYALNVVKIMYGKKIDPYKSSSDQEKLTRTVVQVMVFSSILISLFLMMTAFADRNDLEVLDPPLVSFYMQICTFFGIGLSLKNQDLKDMDFEVYKEEEA